jgi:hypothetical protein
MLPRYVASAVRYTRVPTGALKAALMTPAWGGSAGRRPAFAIMAPDRGFGRTTLASTIGHLHGGSIALDVRGKMGEDRLVSRLLTPSALARRVVTADNVKGSYSSGTLV